MTKYLLITVDHSRKDKNDLVDPLVYFLTEQELTEEKHIICVYHPEEDALEVRNGEVTTRYTAKNTGRKTKKYQLVKQLADECLRPGDSLITARLEDLSEKEDECMELYTAIAEKGIRLFFFFEDILSSEFYVNSYGRIGETERNILGRQLQQYFSRRNRLPVIKDEIAERYNDYSCTEKKYPAQKNPNDCK
jgi:hypothetical protein